MWIIAPGEHPWLTVNILDRQYFEWECLQLFNRHQSCWETLVRKEGQIHTSMGTYVSMLVHHRHWKGKNTFAGPGRKLLPTWEGARVHPTSHFEYRTYQGRPFWWTIWSEQSVCVLQHRIFTRDYKNQHNEPITTVSPGHDNIENSDTYKNKQCWHRGPGFAL